MPLACCQGTPSCSFRVVNPHPSLFPLHQDAAQATECPGPAVPGGACINPGNPCQQASECCQGALLACVGKEKSVAWHGPAVPHCRATSKCERASP